MNCVNCGQEAVGKFCAHCGQPTEVKRMTLRHVLDDVQERFLGFDNLFMRTILDATIRPGSILKAVFAGNRRRYIGAGGYLFLMLSLMLLLFEAFSVDSGAFFGSISSDMQDPGEMSARQQELSAGINGLVTKYFRLISFLIIPLYALFSRRLFRKSGLNFTEHAAIFCYANAHPIWLTIVFGLLFRFAGVNGSTYLFLIGFLYSLWLLADYFREWPLWRVLLKGVLVQLFALLTLGVLGILLSIPFILSGK